MDTHKLQPPNPVETKYYKGQEVFSLGMGHGKIQFIGDAKQHYPILVKWDDPNDNSPDKFEDFMHDGRVSKNDFYPTLLIKKPDLTSCFPE